MLPYRLMEGGDLREDSTQRGFWEMSFTVCLLTSCIHHILKKMELNNGYIIDIINSIEHALYIYPSRINTLHCLSLKTHTQMQHSTYLEDDPGWFN